MQLRHLRYFVKIVDAGSFSRAATVIHVAQPALSQQIAELEEKLGVSLLQRSARGVRPTAAGEVLYREASAILRLIEKLPGIVRSSIGDLTGAVALGMSSTMAAGLAGSFIECCRSALPGVTLKFSVGDSDAIKARVEAHSLDLALVFEAELLPIFARHLLFRQRLHVVWSGSYPGGAKDLITLGQLAQLPLILPGSSNVTRRMLDRAFNQAGLVARIVAEADQLPSLLAAVRAGIGATVLPRSDLSGIGDDDLAAPPMLDPQLFLTASIISSSDYPLTSAGEAVRDLLAHHVGDSLREAATPGAEWIGDQP